MLNGKNPRLRKTPYCRGECNAVHQVPAPHNTCGSCWLGTAQQFHHDMRGEGGSQVTSKLKQGARTLQPTAWPLPHARAKPYHAGSGSHGELFRPYWGSSAWHSRRSVTEENPFMPWRVLQVPAPHNTLRHGCLTLLYATSIPDFFLPLEQSRTALHVLGCSLAIITSRSRSARVPSSPTRACLSLALRFKSPCS